MGLLQEAAIVSGDLWRNSFCVAHNLLNPNQKASVKKIVNKDLTIMHVYSDDDSFHTILRDEEIPKGPFPGALLAARFRKAVHVDYEEIPKRVVWKIVFESQKSK